MATRTGLSFCLVLVCWSYSLATADGPALADDEARFQALLAEAKKHPETADWKALRLAFTKTRAYQPYSTGEPIDKAPVEQELKNGERAAALHALDRVLEGHWVDPSVHEYAAEVCERIDEPVRARLHETFMTRILDTIFGTGDDQRDGRSFDEAWPVLTIGEEYLILDAFDLKDGDQALIEKDGHFYDVHIFKDAANGQPLEIYFNVDLPRQWLTEHGPDD